MKKITKPEQGCPILSAFEMISGKWKFAIIYALLNDKKRFKELEREVEGISTRMLVKSLSELQHDKIIQRKAYPTIPPKVEYSLTAKGKGLEPVLYEIQQWGMNHT
ncbi:MAG: helix-turn-helix domain-containing protein [Bacteroidia bacterium]|nr:helix-turn-helix domain-containing protein [Bacteroidia bacterium]